MTYESRAYDRDGALLRRQCGQADDLRMYLRDWITEEVKESRIQLQVASESTQGSVKTAVDDRLGRLEHIWSRVIWDLDELVKGHIADVRAGGFLAGSEARTYMEQGIRSMEQLVEELLIIRNFLIAMQGEAPGEP